MCVPPVLDRVDDLGLSAGAGMKKIAEDHKPRCFRVLNQLSQPREVLHAAPRRHRYARRAEGGAFADMNVGDEQRLPPRPPDRALRQQMQRLPGEGDSDRSWQGYRHGLRATVPDSIDAPRAPSSAKNRKQRSY